jgi:hypothetical protein
MLSSLSSQQAIRMAPARSLSPAGTVCVSVRVGKRMLSCHVAGTPGQLFCFLETLPECSVKLIRKKKGHPGEISPLHKQR